MKKIISIVACGAVFATVACADIARVEMGAGAWMQQPSGDITYTQYGAIARDKSLEKDETTTYAWLLVKHPIPIIPNLRVEYANIKNSGEATGSFKEFAITGVAKTALEMKQFDIIPYYNILDNMPWITIDLGIDAKVTSVSYEATGNIAIDGVPKPSYSESKSLVIPLLYARARVEIPTTDIGLEADIKYIGYSSNSIYDFRAKVDYTLDFVPIIQPAVELGYRVQKIKIDEGGIDATMNYDFSGVYAGLMLRF